jgi:isoleucyl-tRNA synthetase
MAPFLSFTAEEAWGHFGGKQSIFFETYHDLGQADAALLSKWQRLREVREVVNKDIEAVRANGLLGSALQAHLQLQAPAADLALLQSLGDDLKFVFITSAVTLTQGDALNVHVLVSNDTKCERCWHYRSDVGHDATHPTLCGRCTSNLYGDGETRHFA